MSPSPLNAFDVRDRVAVVTGGSRGIGRAVAEGFAALGAHVVVASRKAEACEETVESIRSTGGSALAVPTHVGRSTILIGWSSARQMSSVASTLW